jgi:hypothetical protein
MYLKSANTCSLTDSIVHPILFNSTEMSSSWEAASCAATQEFSKILWNPKVHYRFHKSPPLVPIRSQIHLVHITPSYLSKIHFNIIHPHTSWSSCGLFLSGFRTKILYVFLFSSIRATCPAHLIFLYLIIPIVLGEEYKLRSSHILQIWDPFYPFQGKWELHVVSALMLTNLHFARRV